MIDSNAWSISAYLVLRGSDYFSIIMDCAGIDIAFFENQFCVSHVPSSHSFHLPFSSFLPSLQGACYFEGVELRRGELQKKVCNVYVLSS